MAGIRPGPNARVAWRDRVVTASETVRPSDDFLLVDTTTGSVTLTLPLAASVRGQWLVIKKLVAANTLTVQGSGADLVDGVASVAWTSQYEVRRLYAGPDAWHLF